MMGDDDPCPEWLPLLHGLADGELDAEHAQRVEAHLAAHPACAREMARILSVRKTFAAADLRWETPAALRERILASLSADSQGSAKVSHPALRLVRRLRDWLRPIETWSLPASFAVLLIAIGLLALPHPGATGVGAGIESELVAGHVRSLLADHLTDVATSDRHTVKPWFNGRVDFSPPVVDLAAQGFPLKGGRVDYIGGRVVAALAFQHQGHVINLFIWSATTPIAADDERGGFNLIGWTRNGLTFWAVSDASGPELHAFQRDFIAALTE